MCTIAQALEDRGMKRGMECGMKRGIAQGEIKAYYSLVNENIITSDIAAEQLKVSVQELEGIFERYGYKD